MMVDKDTQPNLKRDIALVVLVFSPVYLNDFGFILARTVEQVYSIDYISKASIVLIVLAVPFFRGYVCSYLGPLGAPYERTLMMWIRVVFLTCLAIFLMMVTHYYIEKPLERSFLGESLFRFPKIETPWLYWFDMTVGLALNAVAEEFAARGVMREVLGRYTKSIFKIIIISSLIFALAHWSNGVPNVTSNFVSGIILMWLFIYTRSLWPPILAHYFINVWHFA